MAATTAAPRTIILRRDRQLDPWLQSEDTADSASFVRVGMFIAQSLVALDREAECLQFVVGLKTGSSDLWLLESDSKSVKSEHAALKAHEGIHREHQLPFSCAVIPGPGTE